MLWLVPAVAFGVYAFGLDLGWLIDDHVHRAALTRHPELAELHRDPSTLFSFVDGDPRTLEHLVAQGHWPWWSATDLRLAFWRPVSGWTHVFDYWAWPNRAWPMHVHSLAWFVLGVGLLGLLYRRLMPSAAVAAFAALLFAVDDGQALPALWLAQRNAAIALALGLGALLAHDLWRHRGARAAALAGPPLLLAAVLANEGAVAVGGYLLAYALFIDPAPRRRSLLALIPMASTGLLWALAYRAGNFGAHGSGGYIDPISELPRFVATALERAPVLLWGWWGFPPADLFNVLPNASRVPRLLIILVLLACLGWCLRPVLARHAVARFWCVGMLLALVPACSTFPSNRLLSFVGIGASGLLALLMRDLATTSPGFLRRWGKRAVLAALVLVHLVAAPLMSRMMVHQMAQFDQTLQRTGASLSERMVGAPAGSTAIVVAAPSAFLALGAGTVATVVHGSPKIRTVVLSASLHETEVTRTDERTLLIRPLGGFLLPATAPDPIGSERPGLDPQKSLLMLDHLFRDLARAPFEPGDQVRLDGLNVRIAEVDRGRPMAVAFQFDAPLEDVRWQWLAWRDGAYRPFPVPAVGSTTVWPRLPVNG